MNKLLPTPQSFSVNKKGFTLVELLVVITIIAILSVIGMAVFTGVQKNARDSRRKSDISAMSKALETKFDQTTGKYPTALANTDFSTGIIPDDPQGSTNPYKTTLTTSSFTLCAKLENSTGNADSDSGAAKSNGIYYCLKNSQ